MIERFWPLVFAIIIAAFVEIAGVPAWNIKRFGDILSAVINISAILIGFLATMISILITSSSKNIVKRLQQHNCLERVTEYFNCAIISGLFLACFSTFYNVLIEKTEDVFWYIFIFWIFCVAFFVASAYRIMYLMLKILKRIMSEAQNKGKSSGAVSKPSADELTLPKER